MRWFVIATLTPAALLALAGIAGGAWVWVSLGYITAFIYLADRLSSGDAARRDRDGNTPTGRGLSMLLGLLHVPLLALAVLAVAGAAGPQGWDRLGAFLSFGLFFGQVSNSNAHELIHRGARLPRLVGQIVYASLFFGHHASAHPMVHHVHVATARDPNSPRPGEGFYRFAPRAWVGSFRAGLAAENALTARIGRRPPIWAHPYSWYVLGAVATASAAWILAGPAGLGAALCLGGYAQMQLLLTDYVQHYGLRRQPGKDGRPEPVGPQHSWNSPHLPSSAMMLNAPRHSDHHMHPGRAYPALELDRATMPILPYSLPVMAVIALVPPLYRRVIGGRLSRVRAARGAMAVAS